MSRAAAVAGFTALAAVYLALPDAVFVFDGVMFSGIIERGAHDWRWEVFNPRHLLFNPFFIGLKKALAAFGLHPRAYPLIQKVNALAGAAGIVAFYAVLRSLAVRTGLAAGATAALAFSFSYWSRATEGQVYMLMTLGSMATAANALVLSQGRTVGRLAAVAVSLLFAVCFHTANIALLPMVLLSLHFAAPGERATNAALTAWLLLLVVLPFTVVYGIWTPAALARFLAKATEARAQTSPSLAALAEHFLLRGGAGAEPRLPLLLREFWASLAAGESPPELAAAAAGALWFLPGAGLLLSWRRWEPARRKAAALILVWAAGPAALNAVWGGGTFFGAPLIAAWLAGSVLVWDAWWPRRLNRAALAGGVAAAAGLAAWNLSAGMLPRSRVENNPGYRQAMFVREHTLQPSITLISGVGFPNSKVYLPHFAQRAREVLEYYLDRNPKERGLELFANFVAVKTNLGMPLYVLSDLIDDPEALGRVAGLWGVMPEEIRACLGPGELHRVAAGEGLRIYLFIPRRGRERTFAALSYGILLERGNERLIEIDASLRKLAASMTPEQRRATAALLRSSVYGAKVAFMAFFPFDSPQALAGAEKHLAAFARRAAAPDAVFLHRVGNLYLILGEKTEALAAWERAFALNPDPRITADLRRVRGSPRRAAPRRGP